MSEDHVLVRLSEPPLAYSMSARPPTETIISGMPETHAFSDICIKEPSAMIAHVYKAADVEYRNTKQDKQAQFAHEIAEAEKAADKNLFKKKKKQVDNHASAVATRARHKFIVSYFEELVIRMMTEASQLVDFVEKLRMESAKKDQTISDLNGKLARLIAEQRQQRLCEHKTDDTSTEHSIWPQFELPMGPSLPLSLSDLMEGAVPSNSDTAPGVADSPVSTIPEAYAPRSYDEMSLEPSKLEPASWDAEFASVIMEQQASMRACLKHDEPDDSYNPVA